MQIKCEVRECDCCHDLYPVTKFAGYKEYKIVCEGQTLDLCENCNRNLFDWLRDKKFVKGDKNE